MIGTIICAVPIVIFGIGLIVSDIHKIVEGE